MGSPAWLQPSTIPAKPLVAGAKKVTLFIVADPQTTEEIGGSERVVEIIPLRHGRQDERRCGGSVEKLMVSGDRLVVPNAPS
jgi:hypothetical protein